MKYLILGLLLTLSLATKTDNDKNPAQVLVDHLNNIELKLRQEQSSSDGLGGNQQHQCKAEISFRREQVGEASLVLDRSTEHQLKCKESKAMAQSDLTNVNGYNHDIVRFLTNARKARASEGKLFKQRKQSIDEAIKALDGAFKIVSEFRNSKASFLEVANQMNNVFRKAAKSGFGAEFAQVFPTLVQLTKSGEVSGAAVQEIKNLLEALKKKLQGTLAQLVGGENTAMTSYNQFQNILTDLLRNIKKSEKDLRIYIAELRRCIAKEGDLISSASQKKSRNSRILALAEKMCNAFKTEYETSSKGRTDELSLIAKLRSFINAKAEEFAASNAFDANKK